MNPGIFIKPFFLKYNKITNKINPSNNPPFGSGGLSISAKVNGEQTITYTPPDVLTAEQIDNSGFDAGEFAIFNSDGNLVTSNLKKNLLINAASSDFTVPTSHTVYKYGQNISDPRRLVKMGREDETALLRLYVGLLWPVHTADLAK